jgi:hypothetical protein
MIVAIASPSLGKFDGLGEAWETDNVMNLGKIKAYRDVFAAFQTYPIMALFGSGPGTFYSRAGQQFYIVSTDIFWNPSRYLQFLATRKSNSMGGVIEPTVSVEPFYKKFYVNDKIYSVGTGQVDSPFSSYAGLLGETGAIGTVIYLSFYIAIFRRLGRYCSAYRRDPNIFPLITTSIGFLIYTMVVSTYNPWLETGRMTTILWAILAIVCQYAERKQSENDKLKAVEFEKPTVPKQRVEHEDAVVLAGEHSRHISR